MCVCVCVIEWNGPKLCPFKIVLLIQFSVWKSTKIDFISIATSRFNYYLWPCHQKLIPSTQRIKTNRHKYVPIRCRCTILFDKYSVHSENKKKFIHIHLRMNEYFVDRGANIFPHWINIFRQCCCFCLSKIISILVGFYSSSFVVLTLLVGLLQFHAYAMRVVFRCCFHRRCCSDP